MSYFLKITFSIFTLSTFLILGQIEAQDSKEVIGRWDMTIDVEGSERPSWLEIQKSGVKTLVGRFVADGGSARPISEIKESKGKFSFTIPKQWIRKGKDMSFEFQLAEGNLVGEMHHANGKTYPWVAQRAPKLTYIENPKWGEPISLFNGKDLSGWHTKGDNQWLVENGVLKSPKSGSNIISDQEFENFKLHIEFRYPKDGNSGVYLRGRYEVQIEDSKGKEPGSTFFGGVYGFLTPNEMVAKDPGVWQSYDITLNGRRVTVVANEKAIIVDQIIPGITGGALSSDEGKPGPFFLQGDHGPIEYRNIIVTPMID